MASLSHVTAGFSHPVLTSLTDVNFKSLTTLQRELNANASSVHSFRGTGTHGHLVLVCRPAVFATISPVAFIPPPNPGAPPATAGLTATARASAFKTYFTTAYKDLHRHTTSSAGYHSANVAHVANVAYTKPDTTKETLDFIKSEIMAIKLDIAAQQATIAHPPPVGSNQRYYCHTHGISANASHTSATCTRKGPDHKDGATIRNKMGGSTRDWKPRP
jgi:hypothetical protein